MISDFDSAIAEKLLISRYVPLKSEILGIYISCKGVWILSKGITHAWRNSVSATTSDHEIFGGVYMIAIGVFRTAPALVVSALTYHTFYRMSDYIF